MPFIKFVNYRWEKLLDKNWFWWSFKQIVASPSCIKDFWARMKFKREITSRGENFHIIGNISNYLIIIIIILLCFCFTLDVPLSISLLLFFLQYDTLWSQNVSTGCNYYKMQAHYKLQSFIWWWWISQSFLHTYTHSNTRNKP